MFSQELFYGIIINIKTWKILDCANSSYKRFWLMILFSTAFQLFPRHFLVFLFLLEIFHFFLRSDRFLNNLKYVRSTLALQSHLFFHSILSFYFGSTNNPYVTTNYDKNILTNEKKHNDQCSRKAFLFIYHFVFFIKMKLKKWRIWGNKEFMLK